MLRQTSRLETTCTSERNITAAVQPAKQAGFGWTGLNAGTRRARRGPSIVKVHAHCHACDSDFVAREPIGLTAVSGGAVLSCTHCSNRQAIGQGVFDDLPASGRSPASRNTGA